MEEKNLYFRTQANVDNDDGIDDSIYVPASSITGLVPTSTTALTIFFESVKNNPGFAGGTGEEVIRDSVVLNCTAGKVKQVMQTIVRVINSTSPLYNDGVITIADDVTTNLANETVSAVYIDSGITSCGAISVAGALS